MSIPSQDLRFQIFQLQILARTEIPLPFDDPSFAPEATLARKNQLLMEAIRNTTGLTYRDEEVGYNVEQDDSGYRVLLTVDNRRTVKRVTKSRVTEEIPSWPFLYVMVDGSPVVQRIAVQVKPNVFSRPHIVADLLSNHWSEKLRRHGLLVQNRPIFDKREFWEIVERYPNNVSAIEFEIDRPNMARISRSLTDGVRRLQEETNASTTDLAFRAAKDDHLTVNNAHEEVSGLVDYTSKGGGKVRVKIREATGIRTIKVSEEAEQIVSLKDIEIEGDAPAVGEVFGRLADLLGGSIDDDG